MPPCKDELTHPPSFDPLPPLLSRCAIMLARKHVNSTDHVCLLRCAGDKDDKPKGTPTTNSSNRPVDWLLRRPYVLFVTHVSTYTEIV